jgi:O-antigen ligase
VNKKIHRRHFVIITFIITILVLFAVQALNTTNFDDYPREQLWKIAVTSIKEKPLLGVGTGGMKAVISTPETVEKIGQTLSYPHNQYLGEIMHFGITGAIPLFAVLIYLLIIAIRHKNFLLLSSMVILSVFMMTEMPFDLYKSINYFLFFTSLFVFRNQTSLRE